MNVSVSQHDPDTLGGAQLNSRGSTYLTTPRAPAAMRAETPHGARSMEGRQGARPRSTDPGTGGKASSSNRGLPAAIASWIRRHVLGDRGRPSYSPRRLVAVVTLDLYDTGEIAIPIQRGPGAHRLPRGAAPVLPGERR